MEINNLNRIDIDTVVVNYVDSAVDIEESARISADSSLQGAIENEESRALSAEAALGQRIDNVLSNIDPASLDSLTELVSAFEAADDSLSGAITTLATTTTNSLNAEITSRQAAVSAEQSARISADSSLQSQITQEISRAVGVEASLQSQISQEISSRQSAISSEASSRISGDSTTLQNAKDYTDSNILTEQSARSTADATTLQSARSYTDTSISTALSGVTSLPVGAVCMYAGSVAPSGYLLCDGSAVSRSTYSALFAVISTTYGIGNGSTTFNLPNPDSNANIRLIIKV
jgi:hypothetical protein